MNFYSIEVATLEVEISISAKHWVEKKRPTDGNFATFLFTVNGSIVCMHVRFEH